MRLLEPFALAQGQMRKGEVLPVLERSVMKRVRPQGRKTSHMTKFWQ